MGVAEQSLLPICRASHGHRDATMILMAFRHGLRAAEACDLRWDQVDFNGAILHTPAWRRTPGPAPAPAGERDVSVRT
jgi:integrase